MWGVEAFRFSREIWPGKMKNDGLEFKNGFLVKYVLSFVILCPIP